MSGILTKWLVCHEHTVAEDDLDADGTIRDETVERWVTAAVLAYLDRCTELRRSAERGGLAIKHRINPHPRGSLSGKPEDVIVTASTSEVRPESFTISVRLRPGGGDTGTPLNARCVVRLEDPATGDIRELGRGIRDELIALEHSAGWFN
jgi:hypothetical protein